MWEVWREEGKDEEQCKKDARRDRQRARQQWDRGGIQRRAGRDQIREKRDTDQRAWDSLRVPGPAQRILQVRYFSLSISVL